MKGKCQLSILKYTKSIHWSPKAQLREKRATKNNTKPQREPNQSIKLIKDKRLSSINNLVHDHRLQIEECFSLWLESSSFQKQFCFFASKLFKKCIKGLLSKPFTFFAHERTMPT